MEGLPKVLPVNELKNTANIMKICQESDKPIIITRNGYGEAVMMSIKVYEEMFVRMKAAILINESLDEIDAGAKGVEADVFLKEMKEKYGSKSWNYNLS